MVWAWVSFIGLMVVLIGVDLALLQRRPRVLTAIESVGWSFYWLTLAGGFNAAVWFLFRNDVWGLATSTGLHADEASLRFLTGFLTEFALDLDTVFVLTAVFAHRRTPKRYQHLVLFYGLLLAVLVRGGAVAACSGLIAWLPSMRVVLALLLVLAALRMLLVRQENADPSRNVFVWLISRVFPVQEDTRGPALATVRNGRVVMTPLLVTIVLVETADAVFAFDSVPASYALTGSSWLSFTSGCFALLCLRALFFAIRDLIGWIRYVKVALAAMLVYCAVIMSLPKESHPPEWVTLVVVSSLVAAGVGAALIFYKPGPVPMTSPLGEDVENVARLTTKQARRLVVLVVGVTLVGLGIAMLVGPGPGLLVIPIGLGLLATEFVWAKRLQARFAEHATRVGRSAGGAVMKRSKPWLIPVVIGGTVASLWALSHYSEAVIGRKIGMLTVMLGAIPMFIGQAVWAVLVIQRWRAPRHEE